MTATSPAPALFSVRDLTKVFQTAEGPSTAVKDVNFDIAGNTFFTMLGPSGCGKTTTLRMIAGLETITSGQILFNGEDFRRKNAFERNIGMVFQSYALFPHMTVFENAAYGLRLRGADEATIKQRVTETLAMLRLDGLAQRYPADLSGGQQQRVSIGRALVYHPGMLLLDEPLANLDAKLRVEMRDEIRRLQRTLGVMALYVTHDQEEAMAISDVIAVFSKGCLMQLGAPYEIYANPTSLFVADFIGKANFFPVDIEARERDRTNVVARGGARFAGVRTLHAAGDEGDWFCKPEAALLMARPEKMWLAAAGERADEPGFTGRAIRIQFLGTFVRYMVETQQARSEVIVDLPAFAPGVGEGDAVRFGLNGEGLVFEEAAR
jgi:iron(III) transport system ATP-binding protein